jgi:hypothetical protein
MPDTLLVIATTVRKSTGARRAHTIDHEVRWLRLDPSGLVVLAMGTIARFESDAESSARAILRHPTLVRRTVGEHMLMYLRHDPIETPWRVEMLPIVIDQGTGQVRSKADHPTTAATGCLPTQPTFSGDRRYLNVVTLDHRRGLKVARRSISHKIR